MPKQRRQTTKHRSTGDAVVQIDDDQATIVGSAGDGREASHQLDREATESQPAFRLRTLREIVHRDRLFVSGSAEARLGFERAYVAMTHRPDRLVDENGSAPPAPTADRTGQPTGR